MKADLISNTAAVIEADPIRMACLRAVRALNLPDWLLPPGLCVMLSGIICTVYQ